MINLIKLITNRLLLRQWHKEDLPEFARINSDPDVMEFYPNVLNSDESNAMAKNIKDTITEKSWEFWAVERVEDRQFLGFVGLNEPTYELPVTPCIEIGWRLGREYWGYGYATEAAAASLQFAFEELDVDQVYAFTPVSNKRSRSVMGRLNMRNMNTHFKHPIIPMDHSLSEHVLYKITKAQWEIGCHKTN